MTTDVSFAFEDRTLDNGLRVILHEDRSAPVVAVHLMYRVGSRNERPGRTGFAHLFEHLLFQGSEHVGDDQHFRLVQEAGGTANGTTWFERTNYFEAVPSNRLDLPLWLESDRMGFFLSSITQEKLDNQRAVVKNERRQSYENRPYGLALETLLGVAYPEGHSYRHPTIGYMEDLDAASLEDVRDFFRTWYTPNNAVLVVAGDVAPERAYRRVERWFGDIPPGPEPPPLDIPPAWPDGGAAGSGGGAKAGGGAAARHGADGGATDSDGRAADSDGRAADSDGRAADSDGRAADSDGQVADSDGQVADADGRAANSDRRATIADRVHVPRVYMLHHGPRLGDPDFEAAGVLASLLADGKSSRLHHELVYDRRVAAEVQAFAWPLVGTGMLFVVATARPGVSADGLEGAVLETLERLRRGGAGAEELEGARNRARRSLVRDLGSVAGRADAFAHAATLLDDPDYVNQAFGRYAAVGRQDVDRISGDALRPEQRAVVRVVPESQS